MPAVPGLHHITAIASDPQANLNFYQQVLGQRLVKTTVNFDDPGTYHLYYGDAVGSPGTIMTFFPWRHLPRGRRGSGEVSAVAYAVPAGSLDFWRQHLGRLGLTFSDAPPRFGAPVLTLADPDGLALELVAVDRPADTRIWADSPIPPEHAIRGFFGVTLLLAEVEPTGRLLIQELGFTRAGQEGERSRYLAAGPGAGLTIDLLHRPEDPPARMGAGAIHHIAFRTIDDDAQTAYQFALQKSGYRVTPVQDRQYFHSIYFPSPGGVLFEIATDAPGFLYDEPEAELGQALKLPPWLESYRDQIAAALPPLERVADAA